MHYRNKIAMLVAATFSQQLWAQSVSGVVLDQKGQPIAGAEVSLTGSQVRVKTDAAGTFLLATPAGQLAELHVEAAQFAHRNLHLNVTEAGLNNVELRLAPTLLEVIDVKASPLHASATESALPVSVLSGEQLKMQQASTLGDTLKNQVGVHSNFYGSVASSPIIRGLDGPRVMITQNGLDAGDASRVGPDHSVASEAGTAQQIEVLRGPATLFYGSGAIGGVVNVVDERVPTRRDTQANWQLERQSVNNEKLAAAAGQTSVGDVALYADAFWRDQGNYKIPGAVETDSHETGSAEAKGGRVANTDATGKGGTVGASYLLPNGFVGLSVGRLERQYGIPGHAHGGHEHEGHEAEAGHAEERVFADLEQDRVQLHSQLNFSGGPLAQLNVKAGFTDYQHAEIEDGATGTTFKNRSDEARLELLHREWLDWRGGLSLHYKHSDFSAVGEEAFTPPSTQEMLAVGWMEERHFGPLLLQTGARLERVTLKADQVLLPELAAHAHDGSEHDEHDHGGDQLIRTFAVDQNFKPYSLSAGLVWEYQDGYNAALSLSRSGRAPSAAELLSFGPHIGTNAYEIGALFRLNPTQDPHQAFALNKDPLDLEVSNNIDLTWRKYSGDVALILNAFYNQVDNYYYQQNTGLFAEDGHDHADHAEEEHDEAEHADEAHDHSGELPVYLFRAADVTLHGFEAQLIWQFAPAWRWTQQVDYVRARLDAGGDLPRTPPLRLQSALSWQSAAFSAELRYSHYSKQDKVETLESATGSYNLLDANVSYYLDLFDQQLAVYLKGQNLTDEEARVHTSFLKDKAPLPGRSIGLGIRGEF